MSFKIRCVGSATGEYQEGKHGEIYFRTKQLRIDFHFSPYVYEKAGKLVWCPIYAVLPAGQSFRQDQTERSISEAKSETMRSLSPLAESHEF